jgi:hypothetical protein
MFSSLLAAVGAASIMLWGAIVHPGMPPHPIMATTTPIVATSTMHMNMGSSTATTSAPIKKPNAVYPVPIVKTPAIKASVWVRIGRIF